MLLTFCRKALRILLLMTPDSILLHPYHEDEIHNSAPKLARTAAPPLASASISASAPPLPTKPTKTTTKTKSTKKSTDTSTQTWRHPAELSYIRSPSSKHGAWDDMAIVRFIVDKAGFSIPGRSTPPEGEFFQVHFPSSSPASD
ncbi:hypothetical protein R3P38DRAFT_2781486 [Favolaschia claudopus]|uniref:Uncharacterized protein n=1 Tax=Favolaschia claudopus TaxID=2862362 RepID=A0AAW0B4V4_9AGAR